MLNPEIRTNLRERGIDPTGPRGEITKRLQQVGDDINKMDVSYNQSIDMWVNIIKIFN